jgi:signal transduction histidine kinase
MTTRAKPEPVFFWQGLLILLPVGVMAAIGLTAILRDKAAVEQQARQRAEEILQQLAPEMGRRILAELAVCDLAGLEWFEHERQRLEQRGARMSRVPLFPRTEGFESSGDPFRNWQAMYPDLRPEEIFPNRVWLAGDSRLARAPGYDQPPRPPEWFLALSAEQRRSWEALRQAQFSGTKAAGLESAVKGFLGLYPAIEARANADLIQLEQKPGSGLIRALTLFAAEHRGMMSESGVPLSNLALAQALRQAGSGPYLATVLDALVDESLEGQSLLLPELLTQARALIAQAPQPEELLDPMEKLWSAQARLARIAWSVEQFASPRQPTNLWVEAMGRCWFCVRGRFSDVTNASSAAHATPPSGTSASAGSPLATNTPAAAADAPGAARGLAESRALLPPEGGAPGLAPGAAKGPAELVVYPKAMIERAFVRAIHAARVAVPGYFSLTAELAREPLDLSGSRPVRPGAARVLAEVRDSLAGPSFALPLPVEPTAGEVSSLPTLARRTQPMPPMVELNTPPVEFMPRPDGAIEPTSSRPQWVLRLCLADPARLFAQQRQRTLLFGGLIVTSTLAAIFGLAAARGAFYRQLRLSALKSNFVSSVSHELRSPIASVRLMAEGLESGKIAQPAKQQEYFRFIGQECRRLSSLIENVLDFSRIEQGRKQYELEPTDLVALTRQTLKLMEIPAAQRQVKLALAIPEPDIQTLATQPVVDGKAIQQALVNLIDNAMKHSPKDQTVTVGLEVRAIKAEGRRSKVEGRRPEGEGRRPKDEERRTKDEGQGPVAHPSSSILHPLSFLLWVEDHGDGIPTEDHQKIFERFYRRGSELRRQTQGVGIGLSIVKHIVEAHGGHVLVRSAAGQGSRFTIVLPGAPGRRSVGA